MTKACIVIPARLDSSRLPQKLLLNETGIPLIHHTFESAKQSNLASDVVVATDSYEIYQSVKEKFGCQAVMQTRKHDCGTDRVIEVAYYLKMRDDYDIIVNLQGDMPIISGNCIDKLIRSMDKAEIATLATEADFIEFYDPSCVKVVCNRFSNAMYFSRSPIPFQKKMAKLLRHIGIYAFNTEVLLSGLQARKPPISDAEDLEQLAWLYHGHQIKVLEIDGDIFKSIDTQLDYDKFVKLYNSKDIKYGQDVVLVKDYRINGITLVSAGEKGTVVEVPPNIKGKPGFDVDFCVKIQNNYWACPPECIRSY